jgi:PKD repeat protein
MNDPINGQVWGATPAWLIFILHDGGGESRRHHTCKVRHSDTWIWMVDSFAVLLTGVNITFEGKGSDPGSDDLVFTWDWGDGEYTSTTYWNNMVGPDAYPSPEINPISLLDQQKHAFQVAGSYMITLTVEDDDGGEQVTILNFVIS